MKKLINLFLYCGVSKEEYNTVKKDAYIANFKVWKYLHVLIAFVYAFLFTESVIYNGFETDAALRLMICVYSALMSVAFFYFIRKDSIVGQLLIYLTMCLILLDTFWIGLQNSNMMAVSFTVMLVLLSVFMIDKPYFMAILLGIACTAFLLHAAFMKEPAALRGDLINVIAYGLLGIIINVFYNGIRIREFLLTKQSETHLQEQRKAIEETNKLNVVLRKMSESVIEVMANVVENRDTDSGDHVQRVKGFTYILANRVKEELPEYGLDNYTINLITFASALHDVGKISIPDSVLLKPGKLTAEEFEIMKTHTVKGCNILQKMEGSWSKEYLDMGLTICESHHEKWDGKGYPKGLKGDEIPIAAQIVSIADIFDALTSKRVYKDAYTAEEAFDMILNGECGAFSEKMMNCFAKCREQFSAYVSNPKTLKMSSFNFEITQKKDSFVIGLHDESKTLQEKMQLSEELSVIASLTEHFYYICYVNILENEVYRFKAEECFEKILDGIDGSLKSNERFDCLLNTIIIPEDYEAFRKATNRELAMLSLNKAGHVVIGFRINLEGKIHYCRMRITCDPNDENAVIIGILNADEDHERELEEIQIQQRLKEAETNEKNRVQLQDQLAVINTLSSDYDYVCSLNSDTLDVTVYRAEEWIADMFTNLVDIVVSPEVRNSSLRDIIYPDDFERFLVESQHQNVVKGLKEGQGVYSVNYRAYKNGKLVHYQTRYAIDKTDPKRIIIGLHSIDNYLPD